MGSPLLFCVRRGWSGLGRYELSWKCPTYAACVTPLEVLLGGTQAALSGKNQPQDVIDAHKMHFPHRAQGRRDGAYLCALVASVHCGHGTDMQGLQNADLSSRVQGEAFA